MRHLFEMRFRSALESLNDIGWLDLLPLTRDLHYCEQAASHDAEAHRGPMCIETAGVRRAAPKSADVPSKRARTDARLP